MNWESVDKESQGNPKSVFIARLDDGGAVHIVEYPSMSGPEYKTMLRLFAPVWIGGQRVSMPLLWARGSTKRVEQAKREAEHFVADMRKALAEPDGTPTF